ncbi:hypothetical protein ACL6UX_28740, partial [Bacillus anthracis]
MTDRNWPPLIRTAREPDDARLLSCGVDGRWRVLPLAGILDEIPTPCVFITNTVVPAKTLNRIIVGNRSVYGQPLKVIDQSTMLWRFDTLRMPVIGDELVLEDDHIGFISSTTTITGVAYVSTYMSSESVLNKLTDKGRIYVPPYLSGNAANNLSDHVRSEA